MRPSYKFRSTSEKISEGSTTGILRLYHKHSLMAQLVRCLKVKLWVAVVFSMQCVGIEVVKTIMMLGSLLAIRVGDGMECLHTL